MIQWLDHAPTTYEYGFNDACATLCRRLMESLIIELYVHEKHHHEIRQNGVFISLEKLVKYMANDGNVDATLRPNSSPLGGMTIRTA